MRSRNPENEQPKGLKALARPKTKQGLVPFASHFLGSNGFPSLFQIAVRFGLFLCGVLVYCFLDFEQVVNSSYEGLYRFAHSLAGNADDAFELTQETFARFLSKHSQIRDSEKIKAWLSTTLYRTFLGWKRREARHPHIELSQVQEELPVPGPETVDNLESESVAQALLQVEEHYRVPLALYYFEQLSYVEISEVLEIPIGTVMSRLSRGKELLRKSLTMKAINEEYKSGALQPRNLRN